MKFVSALITVVVQFVVGYLFLFLGAWVGLSFLLEGLGLVGPDNFNPWWNTPVQFISMALFASFGVWLVGLLSAKLQKSDIDKRKVWWATLAGSALGIIIVSVVFIFQPAVGFWPIMLALGGAIIGNFLQAYIWK